MKLVLLCVLHYIYFVRSEDQTINSAKHESALEDEHVVNETLAKFSPFQDFKTLGLPGPEILKDRKRHELTNQFIGDSKNYTIRIRTIIPNLSYNARYEEGTIRIIDNEETAIIKGQFTEHFERKSGGYYIRTIGYILNENGYRQFLIDLSTATIAIRKRISSTALASLVGGNALG